MKKILSHNITVLSLMAFSGCVSQERVKQTPYTFWFTHAQRLQTKPCGCNLSPRGGLQRFRAITQQWAKENPKSVNVVLTGGPAFLPNEDLIVGQNGRRKLARQIIQVWNSMGVIAYSPTFEEVSELGSSYFRRLQKEAQFEFVSSNIEKEGKLLFQPYVVRRVGAKTILVVGVSPGSREGSLIANDPVKSVAQVLAKFQGDKAPDLVVVVSSLEDSERDRLSTAISLSHLILGGSENLQQFGGDQDRPNALYFNPLAEGRSAVRVSLQFSPIAKGFYNAQVHELTQSIRKSWKENVEHVKRNRRSIAQSDEYIEFYQRKLQLTEGFSKLNKDNAIVYDFIDEPLDSRFDLE